ncbi:hypothetical protein C8R44DRAFT_890669 [Mycena epipterygia]|nr:hypothetical protein C8R44DRAFT_890669 [Mycena epipterygia]
MTGLEALRIVSGKPPLERPDAQYTRSENTGGTRLKRITRVNHLALARSPTSDIIANSPLITLRIVSVLGTNTPQHLIRLHAVKDNSHPLTLHPHFYVYPGPLPSHAHDLTLDLVSPNCHFTISPDAAVVDIQQIVILRYGQEAPLVPFMRAARPVRFGSVASLAAAAAAPPVAQAPVPIMIPTANTLTNLPTGNLNTGVAGWTANGALAKADLAFSGGEGGDVDIRTAGPVKVVRRHEGPAGAGEGSEGGDNGSNEKAVNAGANGNKRKEREQEGKGANAGTEGGDANGGKDAAGPAKKAKTGGAA